MKRSRIPPSSVGTRSKSARLSTQTLNDSLPGDDEDGNLQTPRSPITYDTHDAANSNLPTTSADVRTVDQAIVNIGKHGDKYSKFYQVCRYEGNKSGSCLLCSKEGVITQIKMKDSNTTGLKRHLKNAHGNEPSVQEILNPATERSSSEKNVQTFEQRTIEWLAIKYLPFSFFDDDATQEYFSFLNQKETYPKRTNMRDKVLQYFSDMRAAVVRTLKKVSSKVSLTVDGWTSIASRSYYGITIHFIDDEWILQSLPLDFVACNGAHSGKDIANLVYNVLQEFGLTANVQGVTVDNAAVNTTFMVELAYLLADENFGFDPVNSHFRCFAHILNLGVQDTLTSLNQDLSQDSEDSDDSEEENRQPPENGTVVTKVRRLFKKIKSSEQWANKLASCCEAVDVKKLTTTIDVSTRWNSTYRMLRTALELEVPLNTLLRGFRSLYDLRISTTEWEVIKTVCSYLKPFEFVSTILGGQAYVTLPLVIVAFNKLIDKIEGTIKELDEKPSRNYTDEKLLVTFQTGRDKMLLHYRKTNWMYGVALILDPRHKVETFSRTAWGHELHEESVRKFKSLLDERSRSDCADEILTSQRDSLSQVINSDSFDLYSLYESTSQIARETSYSEWSTEFERYCKEKRADKNENILSWWKKHSLAFPNISKMARDFLSIPATSVPSERFFSKAGLIIRKHRNRLDNQSARSQLCLNGWITCGLRAEIQKNLIQ